MIIKTQTGNYINSKKVFKYAIESYGNAHQATEYALKATSDGGAVSPVFWTKDKDEVEIVLEFIVFNLIERSGVKRIDVVDAFSSKEEEGDEINLSSLYWDCDCEHQFIHPREQEYCPFCKAKAIDQPDSRIGELKLFGYWFLNTHSDYVGEG